MRIASRTLFIPAGLAAIVFLAHIPYLRLPYFWDELGQFVPAALDILRDGAWIPHSTVPNAHPPAVMAYLALVWRIVGYSIPATRIAMLVLGAATVVVTFLLARKFDRTREAVATPLLACFFLLADPLFYTQSMMAQLDMPAMLFTLLALLLFLSDRHLAAALACTALVLCKETGVILPLVFIAFLYRDPARSKYTPYYFAPFTALSVWFFKLWRATGHVFGDPAFTRYNTTYSLNPVRAAIALLRRLYYLFGDDFRWIGGLAILIAWQRSDAFRTRAWKIVSTFSAAHILLVSLLGGASLERYLLPVLPLLYIAIATALMTLRLRWRYLAAPALAASLIAGLFINPLFPFPYENNLAMADFVTLQHSAAEFLQQNYPSSTISTAWPLTQALRNPAFGYVNHPLAAAETSDLRVSTLSALQPPSIDVLVLYSRTWEPSWSVARWAPVRTFLNRYYDYDREMTPAEVRQHFGLVPVRMWTLRGQWIEVFAHPALAALR